MEAELALYGLAKAALGRKLAAPRWAKALQGLGTPNDIHAAVNKVRSPWQRWGQKMRQQGTAPRTVAVMQQGMEQFPEVAFGPAPFAPVSQHLHAAKSFLGDLPAVHPGARQRNRVAVGTAAPLRAETDNILRALPEIPHELAAPYRHEGQLSSRPVLDKVTGKTRWNRTFSPYVPGETLERWTRRGTIDEATRDSFLQALQDHVQSRLPEGVILRDVLKNPSNVKATWNPTTSKLENARIVDFNLKRSPGAAAIAQLRGLFGKRRR